MYQIICGIVFVENVNNIKSAGKAISKFKPNRADNFAVALLPSLVLIVFELKMKYHRPIKILREGFHKQ